MVIFDMNVKAADQIKYDENEFGASINSKKKMFRGLRIWSWNVGRRMCLREHKVTIAAYCG
jgi:hypothetical protein